MDLAQFDRDITLAELLRGISGTRLSAALDRSLRSNWRLLDSSGNDLLCSQNLRDEDGSWNSAVLRVELESIGSLAAECEQAGVDTCAAWLELVLAGAHRYSMAADLHLETVFTSYKDLQREHAALQESEQRYRELAGQLEQRVAAQVVLIERSQRQLYQAEKMASVGSLAAGVAHEINNPIGFLRSNLSTAIDNAASMREALLAYRRGDPAAAEKIWKAKDLSFILDDFPVLLAESVDGADRVARIVANLKDYANIDQTEVSAVDLNEVIHTVMRLIGDQPCEQIELATDLHPLPAIVCDRGRLNQVLLSLLQNAVRALSGKGAIRVSSAVQGEEIRIAVRDNGCGIAAEALARIFDPFFTMQDVGKGTGLGLTVSQEIIASYGGHIEVESQVGIGSTFTVCLPLPVAAK
ncbi:MAG: two-component sensor histidine kinase [Burkholderiales bacterium]|nr:two-component sensor histidine kinase [Burkholderiales bacterium]